MRLIYTFLSILLLSAPTHATPQLLTFDHLIGDYQVTNCNLINNFEPTPPDYYCHLKTMHLRPNPEGIHTLSYIDELGQPGVAVVLRAYNEISGDVSTDAKIAQGNGFIRWKQTIYNRETQRYIEELYEFNRTDQGLRLKHTYSQSEPNTDPNTEVFKHIIWEYVLTPISP